ncbi:MAG: hypothetical protein GY820_33350 [Gammaproteobacteria bacterium]|nr:hypothetical protein [Bacteroidota bacterium]MCP4492158.1 hypothetical protein [Gammaproteobacteria bacterium]
MDKKQAEQERREMNMKVEAQNETVEALVLAGCSPKFGYEYPPIIKIRKVKHLGRGPSEHVYE